MPHFDVSDCVFSLQPHEWKAIVSGRIHGPFNSRGAAEAGMQTEQRREAERIAREAFNVQATAYLSLPTNAPIETVLDTLAADLRTEEHMAAVTTELTKLGYDARAEETGGNILCVNIDAANGYWYAGTANENWGMSFWEDEGSCDNLETDCPTTEPDAAKVAAAIHAAFVKAGVFPGKQQATAEQMTTYHADTLRKAMGVIESAQAPVVPAETAPLYMAALNSFWLTVHSVYPNADRVTMPQAIAQAFEVAAAGVVEAWINAYDAGGYSDGNFGG